MAVCVVRAARGQGHATGASSRPTCRPPFCTTDHLCPQVTPPSHSPVTVTPGSPSTGATRHLAPGSLLHRSPLPRQRPYTCHIGASPLQHPTGAAWTRGSGWYPRRTVYAPILSSGSPMPSSLTHAPCPLPTTTPSSRSPPHVSVCPISSASHTLPRRAHTHIHRSPHEHPQHHPRPQRGRGRAPRFCPPISRPCHNPPPTPSPTHLPSSSLSHRHTIVSQTRDTLVSAYRVSSIDLHRSVRSTADASASVLCQCTYKFTLYIA